MESRRNKGNSANRAEEDRKSPADIKVSKPTDGKDSKEHESGGQEMGNGVRL